MRHIAQEHGGAEGPPWMVVSTHAHGTHNALARVVMALYAPRTVPRPAAVALALAVMPRHAVAVTAVHSYDAIAGADT
jgi:hypothetical protein